MVDIMQRHISVEINCSDFPDIGCSRSASILCPKRAIDRPFFHPCSQALFASRYKTSSNALWCSSSLLPVIGYHQDRFGSPWNMFP